jgi:hypothetical protein
MGFLEYLAAGAAPAPVAEDALPADSLLWSQRANWGGPETTGGVVRIEAGRTVVLDEDMEADSLRIEGTLIVARQDTRICTSWILVVGEGRLIAGSSERPFKHRLTITLAAIPAAPHRRSEHSSWQRSTAARRPARRACRSWVPLGGKTAPGHDAAARPAGRLARGDGSRLHRAPTTRWLKSARS